MINDLSLCLKPIIKYIQEELMAKLYETKKMKNHKWLFIEIMLMVFCKKIIRKQFINKI